MNLILLTFRQLALFFFEFVSTVIFSLLVTVNDKCIKLDVTWIFQTKHDNPESRFPRFPQIIPQIPFHFHF
jgi:hypothetical protein